VKPSVIIVRVCAALLALRSVAPFVVNVMVVRVPFMLLDSRDPLLSRIGLSIDAYVELAARVMHISRGEAQALLILGLVLAAAGLVASWLAWRFHPRGRQAVLLAVGGQLLTYVGVWAARGFPGGLQDQTWDDLALWLVVLVVFASRPVAREFDRRRRAPAAANAEGAEAGSH